MTKLRPAQQLSPAKKLTPEVVRNNAILGKLARIRLKEAKVVRNAKKATELDLD